ncbi:NADAR family protein [soil metagenome]
MYPDTYLNKDDGSVIYFFSSPYDPLNNWSAHQVRLWDKVFPTSEHAYHYKKFDMTATDVAQIILSAPSPWAANRYSQTYKAQVRDDWDKLKLNIMQEILQAKAEQNDDVKTLLRRSGTKQIIENSPWDNFWGCGQDGTGENHLGKIWMAIRDKITD